MRSLVNHGSADDTGAIRSETEGMWAKPKQPTVGLPGAEAAKDDRGTVSPDTTRTPRRKEDRA